MSPDLEQRILALATALGMDSPRVVAQPWKNGAEAMVGHYWACGDNADAAGISLLDRLTRKALDSANSHRARAADHAQQAAKLDAALAASGETRETT